MLTHTLKLSARAAVKHHAATRLPPPSQIHSIIATTTRRPTGAAAFSTSIPTNSARQKPFEDLRKAWGIDYDTVTLPTKLLLDALRDKAAVLEFGPNKARGNDFTQARRALAQLVPFGPVTTPTLSIAQVETVLPAENGRAWSLIRELVDTGRVGELERLSALMRAAASFLRIHNIGEKRAWEIAVAGARTFEDVINADKLGSVTITEAMKLSIEHMDDLELMIPRAEIDLHRAKIKHALGDEYGFEITGSYRRGQAVSSDIDLVVWHDSFKNARDHSGRLLDKVTAVLEAAEVLDPAKLFMGHTMKHKTAPSVDPRKVIALTRLDASSPYRQIDIRLWPTDSLAYMLLGNTADDFLNKILRSRAKEEGLILNEYGMGQRQPSSSWFVDGTAIPASAEEDIFCRLAVPYLQPTECSYAVYSRILPRKYLWL